MEAVTSQRSGKWVGLFAIDETMIDGVEDEFQTVGDSQLIEYVRQVMLGSVLTDVELFREIPIGVATHNKCDDLQLSRGKPQVLLCRACPRGGAIPRTA